MIANLSGERIESPTRLANKAAISHARGRLGSEPLRRLFERLCRPLAGPEAVVGCWLAGRRLVAIDETCLDVADTGLIGAGDASAAPPFRPPYAERYQCSARRASDAACKPAQLLFAAFCFGRGHDAVR